MTLSPLTAKGFDDYLAQSTQPLVESKQRKDLAIGIIKAAVVAIVCIGLLLGTLSLSMNHLYGRLTPTAAIGTYSILGILCATAFSFFVATNSGKNFKSEEMLQKEFSLEHLSQLENCTTDDVHLKAGSYVTKQQIKDKKTTLQGELTKIQEGHKKSSECFRFIMNTILTTIVLALLTSLATIFASEYFPLTGLTAIAANGATTGIFFTGLAATIFYPIFVPVDDQVRKTLLSLIQTTALVIATIVGMIFLSQYLPQNTLSSTFYNGTCAVVGMMASLAVIGSLVDACTRNNPCSHFPQEEVESEQRLTVYSWIVPLIIILAGAVFGSLCVNEWASASAQPYLLSAVIIGGIALTITHIAYSYSLNTNAARYHY